MSPTSTATSSPISRLASLPAKKREAVLERLTDEELAFAFYDWRHHFARPNQLAPEGNWTTWVILAGRGYGKTRAGAEWFREKAETHPKGVGLLVAQTPGDARDVMIKGRSGILSICPPWNTPTYEPSNLTLTWPNGYVAHIRSAHNPDKCRGLGQEHAWVDELAAWPERQGRETYTNFMMGLREGKNPQTCITTTPKPVTLLREIVASKDTVVTKGSSYENRDNLADAYYDQILSKFEGSTLGRQEIYGELLEEVEGALWPHRLIEKYRETKLDAHALLPKLQRVVVGVDPSGGVAETGIVSAGMTEDGHVYVLNDASLRASPAQWGAVVLSEYNRFRMDMVIGEKNFGGDMVEHVVRIAAGARKQVVRYKHGLASRGKTIRAEPVVALYEQGRVHHVGVFPALEGEMTCWVPGDPSPNRLDALVWALSELAVHELPSMGEIDLQWG